MQPFNLGNNGELICFRLTYFLGEMAEEWGQIMHNLDRESKEFQDAIRPQVGTTFLRLTTQISGIFQAFTGAGIIAQWITRNRSQNFRPHLPLIFINFYKD